MSTRSLHLHIPVRFFLLYLHDEIFLTEIKLASKAHEGKSIEKSLGKYREEILSEVAKEIEEAVADLRTASCGDDVNEIKANIDSANKAVSNIGGHMSGGGFGGDSAPGGGGGSQGGTSDQTPERLG
ncbi:unnamed protein product [Eruca vesicaria subsp. sativa]|uniref:Uncharacterized protein n=1 Tax=Eruca vesicaria subsp. sativa TaxID=29727 RepID=A0ABC8JMM1_ERUVS|nr:unnamed protein product [Eruca vesicaria subsp. sativa]